MKIQLGHPLLNPLKRISKGLPLWNQGLRRIFIQNILKLYDPTRWEIITLVFGGGLEAQEL
jgi:hypothetical protein